MQSSIFSQTFAAISIVYCGLMTLVAVMTIVIPIYDYGFTPLNEEGQFLYHTIQIVLTLLVFSPQPIALMSFYFSGGIGKNWFSHIAFVALVLSFLSLVVLILYLVYLQVAGPPELYFESSGFQPLNRFVIPVSIFGFLHTWFFTFVYTMAALIVKKVNLWQRFLPIISVFSAIAISIVLALVIIAVGYVTDSQSIYNGYKEATIPHWFMLGSVAWALIGLSAFWNARSTSGESVEPIKPSQPEFLTPAISTLGTPTETLGSNKRLYLILGGITAVVLVGVVSIVGAAVGFYYFSGPRTTFEGIPKTNSARRTNDPNSNRSVPISPKSLKEFIENNPKKLAEFKLVQVETNTKKKWFPNSNDEALATFSSTPNDPTEIVFSLSSFNSAADATKDADSYRKNIIAGKMQIVSENKPANGLVLYYKNEKAFGIMDCRDRFCTSMTGANREKVERFYQLLSVAQK